MWRIEIDAIGFDLSRVSETGGQAETLIETKSIYTEDESHAHFLAHHFSQLDGIARAAVFDSDGQLKLELKNEEKLQQRMEVRPATAWPGAVAYLMDAARAISDSPIAAPFVDDQDKLDRLNAALEMMEPYKVQEFTGPQGEHGNVAVVHVPSQELVTVALSEGYALMIASALNVVQAGQ